MKITSVSYRLQTTRRDPFSDWVTSVDEFFRGRSPFENMLSTFDPFRTSFGSIQSLTDRIKNDVERELNRSFETFDVMEHHPILTDPEHTSHYMRVKTDDNGHVRIKTMKKEQHSDWQTHVEKYYKGKPTLEMSQKKNKSIESAPLGTQSSRTEQNGGRDVVKVEQNSSSKATKA
jgi:hypothetical protein